MSIQGVLLGAAGDTASWAEDTVGMVDKHADKGPACTHTVVEVDQRGLVAGHGAQGAEGVAHREDHSWSKAGSSYDRDQDRVEIPEPSPYDTEVPGLKSNYNSKSRMDQKHPRWTTGVVD